MELVQIENERKVVEASTDSAAQSDDRELIERSANDARAVGELYRRHHQAIALYIRRRVGCSHEAEDLTADTFMAMVKYLPRYRYKGAPFRSWLYRLATTQVNRWARRKRRVVMRVLWENAHKPVNPKVAPSSRFEAEQVRLALLSLPARFQAVVSLHYMESMSISAIAQALGCSEGTVKSRLSRGRDKMRNQLKQGERSDG